MSARLALVALVFGANVALAQVEREPQGLPAPPLAGPKTLVGVVSDTGGALLDSVEVFITSIRAQARTGPNGRFRIDDVKPGVYRVAARRIGYLPQVRTVVVTNSGGATSFALVPGARGLPAAVTTVFRGGISGVVGDTAFKIVPGALVETIGSDHRATSDSTGVFFLDVKPGTYVVRVSRDGFRAQLLGVNVPRDSGRKIVFWLSPSRGPAGRFDAFAMHELRLRQDTMPRSRYKMFVREDINRLKPYDATHLAQIGASQPVDDSCGVRIDGRGSGMPIWSINPDDIEMLEVVTPPPPRMRPNLRSGGRMGAGSIQTRGCPQLWVWLRK